ncbi:hypothetical protein HDE_00832 [Halotydeus destructor]|nr:hypothetical protein HDE_00832 [Halotydeus destructor]
MSDNRSLSLISGLIMFVSILISVSADVNTDAQAKKATGDQGNFNRQYGGFGDVASAHFLPQALVGLFLPMAIVIGIGIILLKIFIISLLLFGSTSGSSYGSGYTAYYPAYSGQGYGSGTWRMDGPPPVGRSLAVHDFLGRQVPSYLTPRVMSFVDRVAKALDNVDSKSGQSETKSKTKH